MRDGIEEAMSNAIGNAITDDKGNSLSPEPCALIPSVAKAKANLTVGAHETPAISPPDVDAVGMAIEHLDFTPSCEYGGDCGSAADWWVLTRHCCSDRRDDGYLCNPCLRRFLDGPPAVCGYCEKRWAPARSSILRIEPLR